MATKTTRPGEFLLTEGNGHVSREVVTITSGEGVLESGQVLGKVTATGKFVAYDNAASDGSEIAVAILYSRADATSADVDAVVVEYHAEVKRDYLTGLDGDAEADLLNQSIKVR